MYTKILTIIFFIVKFNLTFVKFNLAIYNFIMLFGKYIELSGIKEATNYFTSMGLRPFVIIVCRNIMNSQRGLCPLTL